MSNSQHYQDTLFFTVTGEGDAHVLIEQYELRNVEGWNKDEIAEERYQFEQMCLRFRPYEQPNHHLNLNIDDVVAKWCNSPQHLKRTRRLPAELQRTLHIVTHGVNAQSAGFHLNRDSIRQLAVLNASVQLHGYQDRDDELDFPYARKIQRATQDAEQGIDEWASFRITSDHYKADFLEHWLNLPVEKSHSIGDFKRKHPQTGQSLLWDWTFLNISSDIDRQYTIPEHLDALLTILETRHTEIWQMAQDYHIKFGISSSGYMSNPHKRFFPTRTIERMEKLGLSLDCDLYFNHSF